MAIRNLGDGAKVIYSATSPRRCDSTEYINWKNAGKAVFPNLKPSLKTISLRLPEILLANLKMLANKKDVPYQTLLKTYLADRIKEEMGALG
jgi:predicted DNA binding CopG/RHH family protein